MLPARSCPPLDVLEQFASRALESDSAGELEEHCSTCFDCASRLREISGHRDLESRLRRAFDVRPATERIHVAGFRIVRELGRGGMGVVYEAEQLAPARKVALKVVRGGQFADARTLALFQREIEAMSRLSHECIAAIHGAGVTPDGEPYFAMELVRGVPLSSWADQHAHDLDARVALLARIAEAVHHAHERGVVHRDLKPNNVIVDERGRPTILDFGLAKILDAERASGASRSLEGSVRGTFQFMAPEQARGDVGAIDARTDGYALGVLAYQLVTHRLPYEVDARDVLAAAHTICTVEPAPPSRFEPRARGDLDAIVLKALAKEPQRRYASAAALADDLERWRHGDIVLAQPPSARYVLGKLIARHRVAFGALCASAAMLVGFGIWMSVLYRRSESLRVEASEQKRAADDQRQLAEANLDLARSELEQKRWTVDFLTRTLSEAHLFREGPDVRVGDLVERVADDLERSQEHPPRVAAQIALTLANVEYSNGRFAKAEQRVQWALATLEKVDDARQPSRAPYHKLLFRICMATSRFDDAERELAEYERELEHEAASPSLERDRLMLHFDRGLLLARRGHLPEEAASYRLAYDGLLEKFGPRDRDTLGVAEALANCLEDMASTDEAEPLALAAVDGYRETLGPEHPSTLNAQTNYALIVLKRGRKQEALEMLESTLAAQIRVLGGDHISTMATRNNLAGTRMVLGQKEKALEEWTELAAAQGRVLGEDDIQTLNTRRNLGGLLLQLRRVTDAEPILVDVVERARAKFDAGHWLVARSRIALGKVRTELGEFDDAERDLLAAWGALDAEVRRESAKALVNLYRQSDRPSEIAMWTERAK
jgi:predicted Ser/Thr protein kinase